MSYAIVVGFEILRLIVSPARGGLGTYKISLQIKKMHRHCNSILSSEGGKVQRFSFLFNFILFRISYEIFDVEC